MKSKITQLAIYMTIDSYIKVTNPDGTATTFETPAKGRDYEAIKEELELTANAYIEAIMSTKFISIGEELQSINAETIGVPPLS